uniref:Uncharacterized protein n=1 Tax=Oryza meridionalis TaxID=40149 RepID=A0A0E0E011_9ORYZ
MVAGIEGQGWRRKGIEQGFEDKEQHRGDAVAWTLLTRAAWTLISSVSNEERGRAVWTGSSGARTGDDLGGGEVTIGH